MSMQIVVAVVYIEVNTGFRGSSRESIPPGMLWKVCVWVTLQLQTPAACQFWLIGGSLYSAILRSWVDSLRSKVWQAIYSAFSWISTEVVYLQRWHGRCYMKLLPSPRKFRVHLTTMHHVTSYVRCMWCLAVNCHLHFWQNDRNLLVAAAAMVTIAFTTARHSQLVFSTYELPVPWIFVSIKGSSLCSWLNNSLLRWKPVYRCLFCFCSTVPTVWHACRHTSNSHWHAYKAYRLQKIYTRLQKGCGLWTLIVALSVTITETLAHLPILMQESFWWWQCNDGYIISLFPHLQTPFPPPTLLPVPYKPCGFCGH